MLATPSNHNQPPHRAQPIGLTARIAEWATGTSACKAQIAGWLWVLVPQYVTRDRELPSKHYFDQTEVLKRCGSLRQPRKSRRTRQKILNKIAALTVLLTSCRRLCMLLQDALISLHYQTLVNRARYRLRRWLEIRPTVEATGIVSCAYLRLRKREMNQWETSGHFFTTMSRAMRDVLAEACRQNQTLKRGGTWIRAPMELCDQVATLPKFYSQCGLSLWQLADSHAQGFDFLQLRYGFGYSMREIARRRCVSLRTAERRVHTARERLREFV